MKSRFFGRTARYLFLLDCIKKQQIRIKDCQNKKEEMTKGIYDLFNHYWSWNDLTSLLELIRQKMFEMQLKKEYSEVLMDITDDVFILNMNFGYLLVEDVIEILVTLIINFPNVISEIEKEQLKKKEYIENL